jgi:hypothetical protein
MIVEHHDRISRKQPTMFKRFDPQPAPTHVIGAAAASAGVAFAW